MSSRCGPGSSNGSGSRPPAVSETIGRLSDTGSSTSHGDRSLHLTDKGRSLATTVVRRHRLAERLLTDVIGLEWEKVHREAARWEHAISADVEEKLVELLGDPATCPHGNPIPGSHEAQAPNAPTVAARDAEPGPITVARISEKLETRRRRPRPRRDAHLMPGCNATIVDRDDDGVTVKTATGEHIVPDERRRAALRLRS